MDRKLKTKDLVIISFVILTCVLIYRILNLGVTIEYMDSSIATSHRNLKIVERFQRRACLSVSEISKEFYAFEKNGLIVIEGIPFACKSSGANEFFEVSRDSN